MKMTAKEMLRVVDHTLLKPFAKWEDIEILCDEAMEYQTASVCIPPSYIKRIHQKYGDKVNICTVVGFPLGYAVTESKVAEVRKALEDGVNEVDMVINIADVKNGDYDKVEEEIRTLKKEVGDKILKVIIETCFLTEDEKIAMCKTVTNAGADFIKTSTGFGTGGATLEDIRLFKQYIGKNVRIKAAGGVKTIEDLENFIVAGCQRIGTSSAVGLLKGELAKDY
jgi:deoxyribose-phosphate aldolase